MSREKPSFEGFLRRRDEASQAFTNGDAGPLGEIVTRTLPSTFFGPDGSVIRGANQVYASYQKSAALFQSGDFRSETLDQGSSDGIGYWVGLQRGTARMRDGKETPFNLRITEIYRLEDGDWKLVHRQADSLATKT